MIYHLHDKVRIKETGETGFIVWISDSLKDDCYLVEITGRDEMPKFYEENQIALVQSFKEWNHQD